MFSPTYYIRAKPIVDEPEMMRWSPDLLSNKHSKARELRAKARRRKGRKRK